jgi:nucleotide-binding universal stress UspA family protein
MAKRILIPLDQPAQGEAVIPILADLARGAGATVRLLHVASVPTNVTNADGRIVAYADQEMARRHAEAMDYLQTIELQLSGVPADCVVRFGDPVHEILAEAEEFNADMIALTTRERSRLGRLVLGGVAEDIFARASVPVALMRPATA